MFVLQHFLYPHGNNPLPPAFHESEMQKSLSSSVSSSLVSMPTDLLRIEFPMTTMLTNQQIHFPPYSS